MIKKAEGATLITIFKGGLVAVALCSSLGMHAFADGTFSLLNGGMDSLRAMIKDGSGEVIYTDMANAKLTILYYTEPDSNGVDTLHRYKQYYIAGEEGHLGLYDASRNQLLPNDYQDILVLPYAYALKKDDQWRFYDKSTGTTLLAEDSWDEVTPEINHNGKYSTKLIGVSRDGLYGAVDQYGQVVIEPLWDEYQPNTFNTRWPISRVKRDDLYGYVDDEGDVVISVKWPYAAMESVLDEETGLENPVIYVYDGDRWGGIVQNDNGKPAKVDWDLIPDEAYRTEHTP